MSLRGAPAMPSFPWLLAARAQQPAISPTSGRAILGHARLRCRLEGARRVDRVRPNTLLSSRPPGLARSAQPADPPARSSDRSPPPPFVGPAGLALSAR